jgi:hypothetical protein
MKIKNYYAWLCPLWIISTLCDSLACVVNFVEGKFAIGLIFLILSVAFAFVSGILLNKAIAVYWHNKEVDWLREYLEELREETIRQINPFEETKND